MEAVGLRTYRVTLTGKSALIMHWDNIEGNEEIKRWRETPENKKFSVAGDDRSPPMTWLASLYSDGEVVAIPFENLMRCMMEGGASVLVPGGKNGKTFKAQSQSGISVAEVAWPIHVAGKTVPVAAFESLKSEMDFSVHQSAAAAYGFYLFVKRARIGASKHVRVRPRFDRWSAVGTVNVSDKQITAAVLADILGVAGEYKGIGDWRPSSPKSPGPFGRFSATVEAL